MNLHYDENFVHITNPTPQEQTILLTYQNVVYSKRSGFRLLKTVWVLRDLLRSFPELSKDTEFLAQGKALRDEMDTLLDLRKGNVVAYGKLRKYQAEDVSYLKHLPSAGVFNEPRTGKTPTTITLLKEIGAKRNLIVCPASLVWNWAKEVETWWPGVPVTVVQGTKPKRLALYDHEGVVIVSKDTLKSDVLSSKLKPFNTCVVDEAHFLRNYRTAQSKAVYAVKAERRYALSGTPTVQHPADIYGILHFLYPKRFPSYWQFCERYFNIGQNYFSKGKEVGAIKPHREQELKEMVGLWSVQRTRKEVMPWLPAKQYSTLTSRLDGKQKKLYAEMEQFFTASDGDLEADAQNVITQLMRMRQLCLDPRLLGFDEPGVKTTALLEYLENNPGPVVIMSMFTSYLQLLAREIKGRVIGVIDGNKDGAFKQRLAEGFQAGKIDVLLCNIISAGTGFTLDKAEICIFTDLAWNPSDNEQAEDRIVPTKEDRNHKIDVVYFECSGTVDERINHILKSKKSLTQYINEGGREAVQKLLGRK